MNRLNATTLSMLRHAVARPGYDPAAVRTGIVHLGLGAFHRAHQAVCTQRVLRDDPRWGIAGVSLRQASTRDALAPQDGLYTLAVRDGGGEALEVIGALRGLHVAAEDPAGLVALLAAPDIRIVSLTVTEKGYCRDAASGALDPADPAIRRDLEAPGRPGSAPGLIVAALAARRAAGLRPFTVLCCDNLPHNGQAVRRVLADYARLSAPALAGFIENELACPSGMVDRIVPATTVEDRARIGRALGLDDAWPVVTEPFLQWIVEDHFPLGRPAWEAAGVQFVADVAPFERMKLRLLNGSHSSIAYLGQLAGHATVADAMQDGALVAHIERLMGDELAPTLHMPPGTDLAAYQRALLARFRNPALRHATAQIAMDGSQKLPQRLLEAARERLRQGLPVPRIALGVAAWMRFLAGRSDSGAVLTPSDPLAGRLTALARGAATPAAQVAALLGVTEVFGTDLRDHPGFRQVLTHAAEMLATAGVARTLEDWPTDSANKKRQGG